MKDLERIQEALKKVILSTQPNLEEYSQQFKGLYEPMLYMLEGKGKRLRPMLTLLAYRLYDQQIEKVLPAAIGLEIYHNHTLLHDDVMDNSIIRHGKPTVHCKWDSNTAILSGDVMLILAFRLLLQTPTIHLKEVLDLVAITMQQVCEGQQLDLEFEKRDQVNEEEYLEMIRLKTSVLPACALKIGALVANAPQKDSDLLYKFGEKIGLAFQLQDDYLDCYANPKEFGKSIGNDLRYRKKTFLLIQALKVANPSQIKEINRLMDFNTDPKVRIKEILNLYNQLHISDIVQNRIIKLHQEANSILEQVEDDKQDKITLQNYTNSMLKRTK